jgi:hypothetical protein
LFKNEKLDFEQLQSIMVHISRVDDALDAIDSISFYLKHYEDLCRSKGLPKYAGLSESFRVYSIEQFGISLEREAKKLRNQVERSNLYYQAKLNTNVEKTAEKSLEISDTSKKIAVYALLISALSVLVTIILRWL